MENNNFVFPEKWKPALDAVQEQFATDVNGGHGLHHWMRVLQNGITLLRRHPTLSKNYQYYEDIVIGFAIFHDSARTHDEHCEVHGPNAKNVIAANYEHISFLGDEQITLIIEASRFHTAAHPTDLRSYSSILQICFDADRLDLWRVQILPENSYLFTDAAKCQHLQLVCNTAADAWTVPTWANELYLKSETWNIPGWANQE